MSGIAAAKKRRAGISNPIPDSPRLPNGGVAVSQPQGLTLQQVISLLDTRLTNVEKAVNNQATPDTSTPELLPSNISEILDDFQQKFVILAGEINSLKDIVLKLQSYTMDVNKVLMEERIQLSNIDNNINIEDQRFVLENNETLEEIPEIPEGMNSTIHLEFEEEENEPTIRI